MGSLPLFWWPIDVAFLESVYFSEVLLFSIYNPVHLIAKLRQAGFDVSNTGQKYPNVKKRMNGGFAEFENFSFFVNCAQRSLMRDEKIVELLQASVQKTQELKTSGPVRVELNIVPMF